MNKWDKAANRNTTTNSRISKEATVNDYPESYFYYAKKPPGKWVFTNKQLYDLYQSIKYKSILINTMYDSKCIDNIVNSVLQPGVFVESITFEGLNIFTSKAKLYKLMQACPKVKM